MKKMIIAACAVFALTSCSDFLEETPVGELTPEQAQDPNMNICMPMPHTRQKTMKKNTAAILKQRSAICRLCAVKASR